MNAISRRGFLTSAAFVAGASAADSARAAEPGRSGPANITGYPPAAEGIYLFQMHPSDGSLSLVNITTGVSNPSFLAIHPNREYLYCVNENTEGRVSSFSINQANG